MKRSAIIGLTLFAAIAVPTAPAVAQKLVVATYHYDNQRTGWNAQRNKADPGKCRKHIVWRARRGRA